MKFQPHVGNEIVVLPLRPAGSIYVGQNFNHSNGSISVQGSSAKQNGGAVLEGSCGVAGDGSGCLW